MKIPVIAGQLLFHTPDQELPEVADREILVLRVPLPGQERHALVSRKQSSGFSADPVDNKR